MTAIVGVINSQGVAIAADSAVTVSGQNVKKVYNRSNKIFTLSKYHPVGISIYSLSDFMGIPLETLIKVYRKNLKNKSFPTLVEYKNDFLSFLKIQLKHVSPEKMKSKYYQFCSGDYIAIINKIEKNLVDRQADLDQLGVPEKIEIYNQVIEHDLGEYLVEVTGLNQANYMTVTSEDYIAHYAAELAEIELNIETELKKKFGDLVLLEEHKTVIKQIMHSLNNIELIFEKYCGLIFIGFGEDEIYPSSLNVLVGNVIIDNIRIREIGDIKISPGDQESNIMPYVQGDVTTSVLTGVDPSYKNEMKTAVKSTFSDISQQLGPIINNAALTAQIDTAMNVISDEFIKRLEDYQWNQITGPLLDILKHMGKEDMAELAESLVNITSLKRKFTSSNSADESVGGPVDVAIITKGDGFIWMKRKHYFEIENNPTFKAKYFED